MTQDERFLEILRGRLGSDRVLDCRALVSARYFQHLGDKSPHLPRPRGSEASIFTFHHTDSPARTGIVGVLQSSWDYHIFSLEWSTGGYALAVDIDGVVYVLASPFAHMTYNAGSRWNPITIATVAVGNFDGPDGIDPTPALLQSIYAVGLSLDDASGAPGGRPWRPHQAIRQTRCPGDRLVDHIWRMTSSEYGAAKPRPEHYP